MNTTAQVKQALQKTGQQMAQEPLELLKAARAQVVGGEVAGQSEEHYDPAEEAANRKAEETQKLKQQVEVSDQRHLEALQNEIRDIRRQKLFNELIRRIQEGEDVPIEEFQELTHEQREVLKAHLEAAKNRKLQQPSEQALVEPSARRSRRLGGSGQKQTAQKQTTRVEKPVPPSG